MAAMVTWGSLKKPPIEAPSLLVKSLGHVQMCLYCLDQWLMRFDIKQKQYGAEKITMKKDENKFDLLTGSVQPENITKVEQ